MKIAMVIGLYPYQIGGAEMQAREIALSLASEGHEIEYICYSGKSYQSEEFPVKIIPERGKFDIFYVGTKKLLYQALDMSKPDIVYHRAFVPYSCHIASWCKKNNVPFYFHSADIYTLIRKNDSIRNILQNAMLRYTLSNATGVICQNEEQLEALKRFKTNICQIIYNIQRKNTELLNSRKTNEVIWIGKFEDSKQPWLFVELAEKLKDMDVHFTMFSSKFPQTEANIKLRERIGKAGNITVLEGKDNIFINDYLCKTAKLLINVSVSEGISNTFIQAWMRGVPVVSLNSNPDHWFDKYEIGKCCDGDTLKLEQYTREILQSDNYQELSQNVINFSNGNFAPEVVTPQLKEFMNIK